jgi:glycyl-tRNA synthetase
VFQIGKAYRNEISPRQYMLRMREFTQAEGQLVIFKDDKDVFENYELVKDNKLPLWIAKTQEEGKVIIETMTLEQAFKKKHFKNKAYAASVYLAYHLFSEMGIPSEKMRLRQHMSDEKAFYADDAWDIEINLTSFGWTEVCGVHDRTDYDLNQHAKASGKTLAAHNEATGKKEVPHIIEIAFGVDRPLFALLDAFYTKLDKEQGKSTFKVPYHMAPIDVAIFPLIKKGGLSEKAREVYDVVSKQFIALYDVSGSIGKRYSRVAEQGVPYAITIDFDSLEHNDCTIRDRDTEAQKRIKLDTLLNTLQGLLSGTLTFSEL